MSSTSLGAFRPLILEQARREIIEEFMGANPKELGCSVEQAIKAVPTSSQAVEIATAARVATQVHKARQAPKIGLDSVSGTRIPAGQTLRITPDDLAMGETRRFDLSDGTYVVVTKTEQGLAYQQLRPIEMSMQMPYPLSRLRCLSFECES